MNNNNIATTGKYPIPYAKAGTLTLQEYARYMMQLRAAMSAAKCEAAWKATSETGLDEASEAANTSNAQKAALKRNTDAVGILTVSFSTNTGLLASLHRTISNDWPTGRAWMVYDRLTKKYEKNSMVGATQRKKMLDAITMKRKEDPQDMFDAIAACNMVFARTGNTLTDEEMILQAHLKLPLDLYGNAITTAQIDWSSSHGQDQMTFDFFEDKINEHYDMLKEAEGTRDNEVTLVNEDDRRTGDGTDNPRRHCNYCGSNDHYEARCFMKYPHMAPGWWKKKHSEYYKGDGKDEDSTEQNQANIEIIL